MVAPGSPLARRRPVSAKPKSSPKLGCSPVLKEASSLSMTSKLKGKSLTATRKLDASQYCKDMRGRRHEIKALRERRFKSVMKGMNWMSKYLKRNNYEALMEVGDDAAHIFFEMWYTSADSRIRAKAKDIALDMMTVFISRRCQGAWKEGLRNRDDFFECMYLLRCQHEMELETAPLLELADEAFGRLGYRESTDALFGVCGDELDEVDTGPWLYLLMNILIMEYNKLIFRGRWPTSWGMLEALTALREHELTPPPHDVDNTFSDAFYLATHIVYALNAYQSVRAEPASAPWLFKYNRHCLTYWMRIHWGNDKRRSKHRRKSLDGTVSAPAPQGNLPESWPWEGLPGSDKENTQARPAPGHVGTAGVGSEGAGGAETAMDEDETKPSKKSKKKPPRVAPGGPAGDQRGGAPDEYADHRKALMAQASAGYRIGFIDIDGVAEAVDVIRGTGQSEASDQLLTEGTLYLLRVQEENGMWPNNLCPKRVQMNKEGRSDHYDRIHPTWVASQALRDRDYKIERAGNLLWQTHIGKLLKRSGFAQLGYKPKWPT